LTAPETAFSFCEGFTPSVISRGLNIKIRPFCCDKASSAARMFSSPNDFMYFAVVVALSCLKTVGMVATNGAGDSKIHPPVNVKEIVRSLTGKACGFTIGSNKTTGNTDVSKSMA
jgi:hypothetical protein